MDEAVLPRVIAPRHRPRAGVGHRLLRDRAAIIGLILVTGAALAAIVIVTQVMERRAATQPAKQSE